MAFNIIIVEDSNFFRMRLTQLLLQHTYNVVTLASADPIAANPHLFLDEVDLIIADVTLPGISGIELTRILNDHPKYFNILGDYICLYDAEGRITGLFGVQIDVTEQKKAEK